MGSIIGLKSDGTVVAAGYGSDRGNLDIENWENIISIDSGPSHTVGLKSDGTVVATGWNESGQCDVEEWKDIIEVVAASEHTIGLKSDGMVLLVGNEESGINVEKWSDVIALYTDGEESL